ncbi:MAG: hypothetical protein IV086_12980 [Hyphomonadaceae bacterium]|nr:MAG: hypothetical protein FD160_2540 [Caulobacteraceae bacterium]MBT9446609.1 hypothetical protein [Hyphomonadaceae bacterium]TPW05422.1 MAG: hypothetical protein FD124_2165 [Alphaproteobacteria bacterium]
MTEQADSVEFRLCVKKAGEIFGFAAWLSLAAAAIGFLLGGGTAAPLQAACWAVGAAAANWALMWLAMRRTQRDRSVQVRIDRFGIAVPKQTTLPIPWAAIRVVKFLETRRQAPFMAIRIDDYRRFGLKGFYALLAPLNNAVYGAVMVNVDELEGDPAEALAAIQRFSPTTATDYRL